MVKLEILEGGGALASETQHATLNDAMREYAGWKDATLGYHITGAVPVAEACAFITQSRNRVISVGLRMQVQPYATCINEVTACMLVEFKAPQAVKLLEAGVAGALQYGSDIQAENCKVNVSVTTTTLQVN